jgi:hypothetical protein
MLKVLPRLCDLPDDLDIVDTREINNENDDYYQFKKQNHSTIILNKNEKSTQEVLDMLTSTSTTVTEIILAPESPRKYKKQKLDVLLDSEDNLIIQSSQETKKIEEPQKKKPLIPVGVINPKRQISQRKK